MDSNENKAAKEKERLCLNRTMTRGRILIADEE